MRVFAIAVNPVCWMIIWTATVRKADFCICENKDADQLRGNSGSAPLFSLLGKYIPSSFLIQKFMPLIICGCTARFMADLVGNPEDWISHDEDHLIGWGLNGGYQWQIWQVCKTIVYKCIFVFSLTNNCHSCVCGDKSLPVSMAGTSGRFDKCARQLYTNVSLFFSLTNNCHSCVCGDKSLLG